MEIDSNTLWEVLKTIMSWAWIPIGAFMSYKVNSDNRQQQKHDIVEQRLALVEQQSQINVVQIDAIREIIKETKDDIKEVKHGVEKLVERLIK